MRLVLNEIECHKSNGYNIYLKTQRFIASSTTLMARVLGKLIKWFAACVISLAFSPRLFSHSKPYACAHKINKT